LTLEHVSVSAEPINIGLMASAHTHNDQIIRHAVFFKIGMIA
jgi:hypothetical protein